jgi:hypothetical protein
MHGGTRHVYFGNYIGIGIIGHRGLRGAVISEGESDALIGNRCAAVWIFKIVGTFGFAFAGNVLYRYINIGG